MKKTITYSLLAFSLVTAITFTSCKKEDSANTSIITVDPSLVGAFRDTTVQFSSFKTIAIADSANVATGTTFTTELTDAEALYRQKLTDSLTARGFTIVSMTANPDLVLNQTRVAATSTGMLDQTGYWNNYAGYYNPSLYGETGLPYAVNMNTTQSINDGLMSFELLDIKDAIANGHIAVIWEGSINGYNLFSNMGTAGAAANAMLAASPYLKAN